jgi:hypothetical protein
MQNCLLTGKVREEKLKFVHQRQMTREVDRLLYEFFDAYPFGSIEAFQQFMKEEAAK